MRGAVGALGRHAARLGELCALSREDVRLPTEGWGALQVVGKGRRLHRLPINRPAADALLSYLADRDDVASVQSQKYLDDME